MASKRRRGRPRKSGQRYRSGNLRPTSEPVVSPAQIAATQPHRAGLGDRAADQRAESELGRMAIRGEISPIQYLAGQRYAAQWRAYVATLDGPRWPWRGPGRGQTCTGCSDLTPQAKCACEAARRQWERTWNVLMHAGVNTLVAIVVTNDMPCPPGQLPALRVALDELAWQLGLTTRSKSDFGYASSQSAAAN